MNDSQNLIDRVPSVALMLPTAVKTCREILQGVLKYANEHGPWAVQIFEGRAGEQRLLHLDEQGFTGFIGAIPDKMLRKKVLKSGIPSILVDDSSSIGAVICDNSSIGTLAAEFFIQHNFQNYAFVGDINDSTWSRNRFKSFSSRLRKAGFNCLPYRLPSKALRVEIARERSLLEKWIETLPKPIALFVANDVRGRQVLNACLNVKVAVPQEVSVLSCDNDELICETSSPPLSSIQMTTKEAGYDAARTLDGFMRRHRAAKKAPVIISYGFRNIQIRNSSSTIVYSDKLVERAMAYLRINLMTKFTVSELSSALHVSRRLLELRFRRAANTSLHQEIIRMRLDHAKIRLQTTDDPIEEIALSCGFSSASHFSKSFKQRFSTTPFEYRQKRQTPSHGACHLTNANN